MSVATSSQAAERMANPPFFSAHPHQYTHATALNSPFWPGTINPPQSSFSDSAVDLPSSLRQAG
jgi:hypothetical protein